MWKKSFKKNGEIKKYNKPYKNGKHTQSLDSVYYCTVFKMFGYRRPLIMKTPILNLPICIKIVLTSTIKSEDMLLWGKGYGFASTETERLWIPYRLKKISSLIVEDPMKKISNRKQWHR